MLAIIRGVVVDWITNNIAIGNYLEAQDPALLRQHGIRTVVSLDDILCSEQATEMGLAEVVCVRLVDGAGNELHSFRGAVDSLRRLVLELPPVLVQCHAGRSRSAAVLAGYLMLANEIEVEEAIAAVAFRRAINMAPALEKFLYRL